ncbi:MAG: zinc ABC transporter substrate-binding protein [Pseudomonadota bacterium]
MTIRRTLLKSAAAAFALSLAAPVTAQAGETTRVVATFSILGDIVKRIGGEHVALTTLVGPDGDAHVYQPTPADARAVSDAEVLIVNGLEFEGWLDRLAEAADFDGTLVVATSGIKPIAFADDHGDEGHGEHAEGKHDDHHDEEHAEGEHGHDHHDEEHAEGEHGHDDHDEHAEGEHDEEHAEHGHGHGHDHGAFDPHAWQSLKNAVTYVDNITAALAAADPAHAAVFQANRAAYVAEIEALDAEISSMMAALPDGKRTVVTSHDAFGYFTESYGVDFKAPIGLSTESEASAADVAELIEQIREEGISAVFVETITDNRLLQQIANETGATIGGTLYSDALSGPDGPAATYLDMMRHNARTIARALAV